MDFSRDVIIDDDAFKNAVNEFSQLSGKLENLTNLINNILDELEDGFNTPAGRKFISKYKEVLLKPLKDQRLIIDHVSDNLKSAEQSYSSVFEEYKKLNQTIESVNIN